MSEIMKVQIIIIGIIFAIAVYGLITTAFEISDDMDKTAKSEREEKKLVEDRGGDQKGT